MTKPRYNKTTWTNEQKLAAVDEWLAGGDINAISKRMGVTPAGIYYWNKALRKRSKALVVAAKPHTNGTHVTTTHGARDAIVFLRKAKSELMAGIRSGKVQDLDNTHLLSLLALRSLQGE